MAGSTGTFAQPSYQSTRDEIARLRLIMEQLRDVILLVGTGGQILDANRAAVQAYGYSHDELLRLNIQHLRSESTAAEVQAQMQRAYDAGVLFETTHKRRDGTSFCVEVSSQRATIDGKDILVSVIRDITDRKQVERQLQLTQLAVENAADANFWISEDGAIVYANRKACDSLGYPREELIGKSVLDVDPSISRDQWEQHWQRIEQVGSMTFESTHRTRDGRDFPVEVTVNHVTFEGRKLHCSFVRSIEDRKSLEEQLRQAQKMEAVGRLAGGLAHDFNNLLSIIVGYTSLIQSGGDPESIRHATGQIMSAAEKASGLTRQLLTFSRKQVIRSEFLNLNDITVGLGAMIRPLVGEDIDVCIMEGKHLRCIQADRSQMEQVIVNLVVNARDAMPNGGRLTIEAGNAHFGDEAHRHGLVPGEYVLLAVSDTGCGMDEQTRAHLFEPFFTTKEVGKGTGLGLATVYGIVSQNNGRISVYSEPGLGSAFKIYLPAVSSAATPTPAAEPSEATLRGNETILLVEDEVPLCELLAQVLRDKGYNILTANSGPDAIRVAAGHSGPIRLLLTDVIMPEMRGQQLAEEISQRYPEVIVMYMSGYTDNALIRGGSLLPGTLFLQKPFTPDVALRRIREVLDANQGLI